MIVFKCSTEPFAELQLISDGLPRDVTYSVKYCFKNSFFNLGFLFSTINKTGY